MTVTVFMVDGFMGDGFMADAEPHPEVQRWPR